MLVVVLIDTWWNVNETGKKKEEDKKEVLIDTWWNVNVIIKPGEVRAFTVLIDTWWNVNDSARREACV